MAKKRGAYSKNFPFNQKKDHEALRTAAITGYLRQDYLEELGFSEGRAKRLFNSKYFTSADAKYSKGSELPVRVLTKEGRQMASSLLGIDVCYTRQSYKHDSLMQTEYKKLTPKEQKSCIAEAQVKLNAVSKWQADLKSGGDRRDKAEYNLKLLKNDLISPPDFSYKTIRDGVEVEIAVEVMRGYSDSAKIAKYAFCEKTGMEGHYIH